MQHIKDWLERLVIIFLVILTMIWVLLRLAAALFVGVTVFLPVFIFEAIIWGITLGIYERWVCMNIYDFIEDRIAPQSDNDYDY